MDKVIEQIEKKIEDAKNHRDFQIQHSNFSGAKHTNEIINAFTDCLKIVQNNAPTTPATGSAITSERLEEMSKDVDKALESETPESLQQFMDSQRTPATSWEEVEKELLSRKFPDTQANVSDYINGHNTAIENILDYLSQHWPSSQPVSPTPMSETWEEITKGIYEGKREESGMGYLYYNAGIDYALRKISELKNTLPAPSLHQVDRWVRVEDLNMDELPKHPTKTWRSALVLITDGNRWGEGYYNYLNSEWEHGHSSYTAKPTHYKIISLPAAPETDKTT